MSDNLISRQAALDAIDEIESEVSDGDGFQYEKWRQYFCDLPSAEPEEVIPHRNYKYLSDFWCECGWHLGKKGAVKYCAECGKKVKWDG